MKKLLTLILVLALALSCVFAVTVNAEDIIDGNTYTAVCGEGSNWTWDATALTLTYTKAEGDSWTLKFTLSGTNLTWSGYVDNNTETIDGIIIPSFVQVDDATTYAITGSSKNGGAYKAATVGSVVIYDGFKTLHERTFSNCTALVSCELPSTVQTVGYAAFEKCTKLTTITIPSSVTSLAGSVFTGCTKLESAYIYAAGLTKLGDSLFNTCSSLKTVVYPDTVTEFGNSTFYKTGAFALDLTGITKVGSSCFQWSTHTFYVIPESLVDIGKLAFQNNSVTYMIFEGKTAPVFGGTAGDARNNGHGLRSDAKITGKVYVPANGVGYEEAFENFFTTSKMTLNYMGAKITSIEAGDAGYTVNYTYNDLANIQDKNNIEYQNDKVMIALYNSDNVLVKVKTASATETSALVETTDAIAYAKIFALDSIASLKPLYEAHQFAYAQ